MENEKRFVYGTRTGKWYLVDKTDRDFTIGIPQDVFKKIGKNQARAQYLSASVY